MKMIEVRGIGEIPLQEWYETNARANEILQELMRLYPQLEDEYDDEIRKRHLYLAVAFTLRLEARKDAT